MAQSLKEEGNALFSQKEFELAIEKYQEALVLIQEEEQKELESVLLGNTAACLMGLSKWKEASEACSKALELRPDYVKVLMRRAKAYEHLEEFSSQAEDLKKLEELLEGADRSKVTKELLIAEQRAKKKQEEQMAEMMGSLKDMGNKLLGNFGLSLDNFQAVQDPNTGSYSINFKQ